MQGIVRRDNDDSLTHAKLVLIRDPYRNITSQCQLTLLKATLPILVSQGIRVKHVRRLARNYEICLWMQWILVHLVRIPLHGKHKSIKNFSFVLLSCFFFFLVGKRSMHIFLIISSTINMSPVTTTIHVRPPWFFFRDLSTLSISFRNHLARQVRDKCCAC